MVKKIRMAAVSLLSICVLTAHAEPEQNCKVELAVSTAVQGNERVAFNITNGDAGINYSVTLKGGSAPAVIDQLPCDFQIPYTISATSYSAGTLTDQQIGQCILKAGAVKLSLPNNSVSVVFPNDFIC
ncbi:Uncharacterised protein (plasmid) [Legionella adelaidensis]|uniref:Uncharacterized protein n=1 Tax=Legionella adelaidensis TaxID=45056 RepID=A0A0W0R398_9GAMM|nr:hypothetical protein [Legionella adelaidensis]KTC65515.1 hypothetical protein Lade_0173 [Legionella adelaidensis]VEH84664.1 Uncharacterised protein [Legionella adelaidensis]